MVLFIFLTLFYPWILWSSPLMTSAKQRIIIYTTSLYIVVILGKFHSLIDRQLVHHSKCAWGEVIVQHLMMTSTSKWRWFSVSISNVGGERLNTFIVLSGSKGSAKRVPITRSKTFYFYIGLFIPFFGRRVNFKEFMCICKIIHT